VRIAVTGARGRLGRAVVDLAVTHGHDVVALDRAGEPSDAGVSYRAVDLTAYEALRSAVDGCDALVHLAAYTSPDAVPEPGVHHNNVVASYNALAASTAAGIRRICIASSVNAVGGVYSREPRFEYFPIDEQHPAYPEDAYSLSKLLGEQQAAAFTRRHDDLSICALRLHALRERKEMMARFGRTPEKVRKDLWGFTPLAQAAAACLSSLTAKVDGFEVFYVVADRTYVETESEELARQFYPDVPVRGDLTGHRSFFDSSRAAEVLT
jgi:nucleoside-diphosphate-sugar epimerase